jgi:hypothetical protein
MAAIPKNIDISVFDFDQVKTMVEILHKRIDEIPEDLADQVVECLKSRSFNISVESLTAAGKKPWEYKVYVDGKAANGVTGINAILKCITVYPEVYDGAEMASVVDGVLVETRRYPEKVEVKCGDKTMLSWGAQ